MQNKMVEKVLQIYLPHLEEVVHKEMKLISIVLPFWRQLLNQKMYLQSLAYDVLTPPLYCHFECLRSTDEQCPGPKGGRVAVLFRRTHSKDWRQRAGYAPRDALLWPLVLLNSGGPIRLAGIQTAGFEPLGLQQPAAGRGWYWCPASRERMVASSVIVTQSHSVKTTTFTQRLTPTQYPFIRLGGQFSLVVLLKNFCALF